jgi:hypothetical protein
MVANANAIDPQRVENLGPAENTINALTTWTDHLVHSRPGVVVQDGRSKIGVRWEPVTWKNEAPEEGADKVKVVYKLTMVGEKKIETRIGTLSDDGKTVMADNGRVYGQYRKPGDYSVFPEVAVALYGKVAEVWESDNDFAAHWASWSFAREYKDMKVVLAAFMLVQSRCGEPVKEDDKVLFYDDDFREVGEAMCLIRRKGIDLDAKLLLRIGDVLAVPGVADINRRLGFGKSARKPAMGRYRLAVEKWLRHRERNVPILKGLVSSGNRRKVMKLAQRIGYKPETPKFYEVLRWKQKQAKDGRRSMAIDVDVAPAETWEGMDEGAICEKIIADRPGWKRIVGLLPSKVGMTRAVVAAAVEAGSMSNKDLIIMTPTLEELGLLDVEPVKTKWATARAQATDLRATNIAKRVKKVETAEKLQEASDGHVKREFEEVTKDMELFIVVDKSASMDGAIDKAKEYLSKFLQGLPMDRLHVSVFNTVGREVEIKHASKAGIEQAFKGHTAGGGTRHSEGLRALRKYIPANDPTKPETCKDVVIIFVGDESDNGFRAMVTEAQLFKPVAFGLLKVIGSWGESGRIVTLTANELNIPCFMIEEGTFDDPYAVTRTIRNLIAATPVNENRGFTQPPVRRRKTLIETILETPLLAKPVWA